MLALGKDIDATSIQAMFLCVLQGNNSQSGSEIVELLETRLGSAWVPSAGGTYKVLQQLTKKGHIYEVTKEVKRVDHRFRVYALTKEGEHLVKEILERIQKVNMFISECCMEYTNSCITCGMVCIEIEENKPVNNDRS